MSALFELLNIPYDKPVLNEGEFDGTERRIYGVFRCKCCMMIVANNYVPDYIPSIVCLTCYWAISRKYKEIKYSLNYKRLVWKTIFSKIHEEIKEIGLQPNRIVQTQFFDPGNWSSPI